MYPLFDFSFSPLILLMTSWRHLGDALEISWRYLRDILGIFLRYLWNIFGIFLFFQWFIEWVFIFKSSGFHPTHTGSQPVEQTRALHPLYQLEGPNHHQHQADQVHEDKKGHCAKPVYCWRHPLWEFPCHDCLHPFLLFTTVSCSPPTEIGGDEAWIWSAPAAMSGSPEGAGNALVILPSQTCETGNWVPTFGGEVGKEHSIWPPWLLLFVGGIAKSTYLVRAGEWGNADEGELGAAGVAADSRRPADGGESAAGEDHLQLSHQLCRTQEIPALWCPEKDKIWEGAGWVSLQWFPSVDYFKQIFWRKSILFWQTPQLQPQAVQTTHLPQHDHGKTLRIVFCKYFFLKVGSSLRNEDDEVGFSLKLGPESALGLDALSVNDRTLWTSKLAEACSSFEETEKRFLTRQKSGKWALKSENISGCNWQLTVTCI